MEVGKQRQIQELKPRKELATEKQLRYLKRLVEMTGFQVNLDNLTKEKAAEEIKQLKKIFEGDKKQMIKENEIRLAMIKKLVYYRWLAKDKVIDLQTEKAFIQEVYYVSRVFSKIDELVATKKAA